MLLLFCFLPALWSAETSLAEMPTKDLVERLMQISQEQQILSPKLNESLQIFEQQSRTLEEKQQSLQISFEELSLGLSDVEKSLESLNSRLTDMQEPQVRLQTTLEDTTNSVQSLQQSCADYARRYDELSSESAAIMEELLRRAGETDFFAEEGEHVSLDNDCVDSIFGADGHSDELDQEV